MSTNTSKLKGNLFDLKISATVQFNIKGEDEAPNRMLLNLQTEIGLLGSVMLSREKKTGEVPITQFQYHA